MLSPHLTVEEAYLLAKYAAGRQYKALVVLGPVPVAGQDETYKNGFTIRAEKCPNRLGVEAIVAHYMGRVATFNDLLSAAASGKVRAAWLSGGYKTDWIDASTAASLEGLDTLVVQDMFSSPAWEKAGLSFLARLCRTRWLVRELQR